MPPGWQPDGKGETTEDMRRRANVGPTTDLAGNPHAVAPSAPVATGAE